MTVDPGSLVGIVWTVALVVWLVSAFATKSTVRAQSVGSRLVQSLLFVIAFLLLRRNTLRIGPLAARLVPASSAARYAGLGLTVAGVAFAIWARFYLGRNWSGNVTIKKDHELIQTGPYALVRHPIYAGFELALLGTALVIGEVRAFLAALVAFIGMVLKARSEEALLTAQFGETYAEYRKRVRGLIPFVW